MPSRVSHASPITRQSSCESECAVAHLLYHAIRVEHAAGKVSLLHLLHLRLLLDPAAQADRVGVRVVRRLAVGRLHVRAAGDDGPRFAVRLVELVSAVERLLLSPLKMNVVSPANMTVAARNTDEQLAAMPRHHGRGRAQTCKICLTRLALSIGTREPLPIGFPARSTGAPSGPGILPRSTSGSRVGVVCVMRWMGPFRFKWTVSTPCPSRPVFVL